ncbi:hypothetical protein Pan44_25430 [Caulifigura coniformis]|uniref:Sulfur globule protein n=1 Tax=Caulifigura coniformis TaxID=2527983 RepID=A0A517SEF1_9PLAN|nr:hypothetical protein [Caulifigura coniformis]QDT54510.1 hypothetical protein Pan44_25430 [Caulifigura coniformis]
MKRFLILAAMVCGLGTVAANDADAGWRYRGGYYGGYGYHTPYRGGGYYNYGYRAPYRSYYRGGWNRGWGRSGFYGGFGRRGGGVYIGW